VWGTRGKFCLVVVPEFSPLVGKLLGLASSFHVLITVLYFRISGDCVSSNLNREIAILLKKRIENGGLGALVGSA
jgi:hypothetical protein